MKQLITYITEKLKLNKDIEIDNYDVPTGLPDIDDVILTVSKGKKTGRDSYVVYNVAKVCKYENDNILLKRYSDDAEVGVKYHIVTDEEKRKIQQPTIKDKYFAKYDKPFVTFSYVYDKETAIKLLQYGITNLRRKLYYIFGGYKLECKGDKIKYLEKLKDLIEKS